jgi:Trk-type K+ transport system membrane component
VWVSGFALQPDHDPADADCAVCQRAQRFCLFSTFVIAFSGGLLCWRATHQSKVNLETRDGFLIIVLFWLLFSAISALPLWLNDELRLSIADALFEGSRGLPPPGRQYFMTSLRYPCRSSITAPSSILWAA